MKTHLTIIGTINIAFGIVGSFWSSVVLLVLIFFYGFIPIYSIDFPVQIIGIIIGSIAFVCSVILIITGIGVLKGSSWARILALIISGIACFLFPWGTAWGIYSIIILTKQETVDIFSGKDSIKKEPVEAVDEEKEEEPPPPKPLIE